MLLRTSDGLPFTLAETALVTAGCVEAMAMPS